jgi:hypothetical protein
VEYLYSSVIDILNQPHVDNKVLLEHNLQVLYSVFPLCHETVNLICNRASWPMLVTFANGMLERTCLFMCDGVHTSINPFGHTKSDWSREPDIPREHYRRGHISVAAVLTDRIDAARIVNAQNLESAQWADMKEALMPEPAPAECPERICVYMGRLQYTGRAMRQHRPPQHFAACVCCGQTTYWPTTSAGLYCGDRDSITTGPISELLLLNSNLKMSSATEPYWARCGGELPGAGCVFCSTACQEALLNEIEAAMGVTAYELEQAGTAARRACPRLNSMPHERVSIDLKMAFKRNEIVAKRLSSSAFTNFRILSSKDAYVLRQQTIEMLNVDTALLVLCDRFYQTKANQTMASPCGYKDYRTNPLAYARPIARVKEVFEKYSSDTDPLLLESGISVQWMQKLRSQASVILGLAPR